MRDLQEWIDSHEIDTNSVDNLMEWMDQVQSEREQIIKDMEKTQSIFRSQAKHLVEVHATLRWLQLALEKASA